MFKKIATVILSIFTASFASANCPFEIVNYHTKPVKIIFDMCSDCETMIVDGNGGTHQGTISSNLWNVVAFGTNGADFSCHILSLGNGFTMYVGVDGQCMLRSYLSCDSKRASPKVAKQNPTLRANHS